MFIRSVLLCLGLSLGCGGSSTRALALPGAPDAAADRLVFHLRQSAEEKGPRQQAASPAITIKLIVDHVRYLLGDPTEWLSIRLTTMSFFPPTAFRL